MYLIIGGAEQGKLAWALREFALDMEQVADGARLPLKAGGPLDLAGCRVLYGLQELLARALRQGWDERQLELLREQLLALPEQTVVICDEVGAGLVPLEREGRQLRELVGRSCCELAAAADKVWRVYCGLAQQIK